MKSFSFVTSFFRRIADERSFAHRRDDDVIVRIDRP